MLRQQNNEIFEGSQVNQEEKRRRLEDVTEKRMKGRQIKKENENEAVK
jgi:hypothetical protein